MDARPASDSEIVLRQLMLPEHANPFGNVHGAWVFKLVDEAAGTAAMRHCRARVVTKLVDQMTFDAPVHVGELVHVQAKLTWTGRTSMEVAVTVDSERPLSGVTRRTNAAFLVFVALDDEGKPTPVPQLLLETPEDHADWAAADARRALRLART
jgi:acyl-CoA hydrolase